MTPEERLTKIENTIQALTETQLRHESEIEKQNAGIRDLIVVSHTLLDSQKQITVQIGELRETVGGLGDVVRRLAENLDRLIRLQERNGGS